MGGSARASPTRKSHKPDSEVVLLKRNTDFLLRCVTGKCSKGESIRTGKWANDLGDIQRRTLLKAIGDYQAWSPTTDPTGNHAHGIFQFEGHYVLFAIGEGDMTPPGRLYANPPMELVLLIKHSSEI